VGLSRSSRVFAAAFSAAALFLTGGPVPVFAQVLTAVPTAPAVAGDDDPYFSISSTWDRSNISSSSGISDTLKSRSLNLEPGDAVNTSHLFDLGADQNLTIGGSLSHDWQSTSYSTAKFGTGTVNRGIFAFGPYVGYEFNHFYLYGTADGLLGSGSEDNVATGGRGTFGTSGFAATAKLGRIFTLFDMRSYPVTGSAAAVRQSRPVGGYALYLDVSGHGGYFDDHADGYTDSVGNITGSEQYHFGFVGARADLFAVVPTNRLLWRPFVAVSVDQKLGFTHTLDIPAQGGLPADVLSYSEGQTTGAVYGGLRATGLNGISVGVAAFYRHNSTINSVGGEVYVTLPLRGWLARAQSGS
jgi:hypothetical protein